MLLAVLAAVAAGAPVTTAVLRAAELLVGASATAAARGDRAQERMRAAPPALRPPGDPVSESTSPAGIRHADLLGVYTNDHLASATGGIELVSRMLGRWRGTPYEPRLQELLDELREERTALRGTMEALGLPVREYKQAAVWLGEKLSRAKLNGHLLSRSPLSDLVEFEFITTAVLAKRAGFETLRAAAETEPRIDGALFHRLIDQADKQHHWLADVRREVAVRVFGGRTEAPREAADS